ncbi:MAG TPA: hypothetical protein VMJ10_18270 [Kofleriaceae bacterium]|nr:hypothetical protein [Kofleriaceae bacterium]
MKLLPPAIAVLSVTAATASAHADNLRVDVSCADFWATPDSGLDVRVDGAEARGGEINNALAVAYTKHGNPYLTAVPTDVGFSIAPGVHHVSVDAPGCAPLDTQVSVGPVMSTLVSGRLPISDRALLGTAGAPDGFGLVLGAYSASRGTHTSTDGLGDESATWNELDTTGGMLTTSYEHRNFALGFDLMVGTATGSGTTTSTSPFGGATSAPQLFTNASVLQLGTRLRIGARLPENSFALAAGAGVGGDANIATSGLEGDGGDFDFYIPLWASVTYKPECNWGVQAIGSYDVHPTSMAESAPSLAVGLMWQPTAACSEQPGLSVH